MVSLGLSFFARKTCNFGQSWAELDRQAYHGTTAPIPYSSRNAVMDVCIVMGVTRRHRTLKHACPTNEARMENLS